MYKFTSARIDRWIERVGIDIRPPIEIELDSVQITNYSGWARKKFPQLFDRHNLGSQGGSPRFDILKTLEYPGKPNVDLTTFSMTPRGPVFTIPKRLAEIDLEPDLPAINEVVRECMKQFLKTFVGKRVLRVGKVSEYIFGCDQTSSIELVAKRFTKIDVPADGELLVRVNLPNAEYNRIVTIEPVIAQRPTQQSAVLETIGYGIKVTVDINNRKPEQELSEADWMRILHDADAYINEDLYNVLNGETE